MTQARRDLLLGGALGLSLLLAGPVRADVGAVAPAAAPIEARCTIQVIQAIEGDKKPDGPHLDAKIEALRPYLSKAPFTAWQKFALLDEKTFELALKQPAHFALPSGKPVALTVLEHMPEGKGGHHRLRVQLEVGEAKRRQLSTVFAVPEGKVVLQVIQESLHKEKGLLVLGTSCGEAKTPARQ